MRSDLFALMDKKLPKNSKDVVLPDGPTTRGAGVYTPC
jgi:hypothetical protein